MRINIKFKRNKIKSFHFKNDSFSFFLINYIDSQYIELIYIPINLIEKYFFSVRVSSSSLFNFACCQCNTSEQKKQQKKTLHFAPQ